VSIKDPDVVNWKMSHDTRTTNSSRIRKLLPFLTFMALLLAVGGITITFFLPSQILKPESLLALSLVQSGYQESIDQAIAPFPKEKTAYIEREACWGKGKTLCVYGWYAKWHGDVYLMSYTYTSEADEKKGRLRGWWWEVDVYKEEVHPVWLSEALIKKYSLQKTEALRLDPLSSQGFQSRFSVSPLIMDQ